jgi:3-deoxy-D-manno-octulosonate 8-phosphate phosphatase (KDO 8-P phosphatase)
MIDAAVARRIKLVALDVDGVLTDGGIYLGAVDGRPLEFKRFDIHDGLGIHLLQRAGVRVAIVTGRVSDSVKMRAAELEIEDLAQITNAQKLPALASILERRGIAASEVAFVGDDFPDLPVLRFVGLSVAPANAVAEVKHECAHVLTRPGGAGAIREFVEQLLRARGQWQTLWQEYVRERSGHAATR